MSVADQTGRDTATIHTAAAWLANEGRESGKPVVGQLQNRFGLTAKEACEAIREANQIRTGAR